MLIKMKHQEDGEPRWSAAPSQRVWTERELSGWAGMRLHPLVQSPAILLLPCQPYDLLPGKDFFAKLPCRTACLKVKL